jgi:hypothetical protein
LDGSSSPAVTPARLYGGEVTRSNFSSAGRPTAVIDRAQPVAARAHIEQTLSSDRTAAVSKERFRARPDSVLLLLVLVLLGGLIATIVWMSSGSTSMSTSAPVATPGQAQATLAIIGLTVRARSAADSPNVAAVTPVVAIGPTSDVPISLANVVNGDMRGAIPSFPVGDQQLGGVRFLIGEQRNTIQTQCTSRPNQPTAFSVPLSHLSDAEALYVLINASYGADYAENKRIGRVEIVFADGRSLAYDLVLGQNIREWRFQAAGAVGTASSPDLAEVHRGPSVGGDPGVVDMLRLPIPDEYRDSALDSITFQDISKESVNSGNPCFVVMGITARIRERL